MGGLVERWVARKGNGWPREMGGWEGKWVAKKGDGLLSRKMGG
jgi:hypothetical protein